MKARAAILLFSGLTLLSGCGVGLCVNLNSCPASLYPVAIVSNAPSAVSRMGFLSATVSGGEISHYKYKLGVATSVDCQESSGYSSERSITEALSDLFYSLPDVQLVLCVVGRSSAGSWQPFERATQVLWMKDMTPQPEARFAGLTNWNDYGDVTNGLECAKEFESVDFPTCVHAGERRVVRTGMPSCEGLMVSDDLDVFRWICSIDNGEAVFESRLKSDKGLQELVIHGSVTGSWRQVSLTMTGPFGMRQSNAQTWWTNPVKPLPPSNLALLELDQASDSGVIFTVNALESSDGVEIDADKVGIVFMPGSGFTSTPGLGYLFGGSGNRLWLEGGSSDGAAMRDFLDGGRMLRVHRVKFVNGTSQCILADDEIHISSSEFSGCSLRFRAAREVFAEAVRVTGGRIWAQNSCKLARFVDTIGAGGSSGAYSECEETAVVGATFMAANDQGIWLQRVAGSRFVSGAVSVLNNGNTGTNGRSALDLRNLTSGTLLSTLALNSRLHGIRLNNSDGVTIYNAALAHHGGSGIFADSSTTNTVKGALFLGNNIGGNCSITGSMNISTGANNTTCSPVGGSGVTEVDSAAVLSTQVVGKVGADTANITSGGTGLGAYSLLMDTFNFENAFRAWGQDGGAFPATTHQDRCSAGTCRIWDASLTAGANVLLNRSGNGSSNNDPFVAGAACPKEVAGDQTLTNSWGQTFLKNAVELMRSEWRGNTNDMDGLCEAGETCLYTPNFGAYQGHGDLAECLFVPQGGLTGVRMYGYTINTGR